MTPTEQIIESEKKLLAAVKNSDVETLDSLLHDQLLFHLPDGQLATKVMDLEAYRSGNMAVHTLSPSDQVIHVLGDTAVVSVAIELKGSYFGQALDEKLRYLRVWKSVDGRWQVIAGSCIKL